MLEFKQPELKDKPAADQIYYNLNYRLCDFSFGNIFIWRNYYKTKIAFFHNFLIVRYNFKDKLYYLFPAGSGDTHEVIKLMKQDADENGEEFVMTAITPEMKARLDDLFPDKFDYKEQRANFDYIYHSENLIQLAGKKYHSKRNHITRFNALGNWTYELISDDNIEDCAKMNDEWCKINGCGKEPTLNAESCAVRQSFKYYRELCFNGGLLRLDGKIIAFSMGEKLCGDTYVVHIEKALPDYEGAYTAINQQFSEHNCGQYTYINREDDVGIEGLRKAKLSYYPAILLEKSFAALKSGLSL